METAARVDGTNLVHNQGRARVILAIALVFRSISCLFMNQIWIKHISIKHSACYVCFCGAWIGKTLMIIILFIRLDGVLVFQSSYMFVFCKLTFAWLEQPRTSGMHWLRTACKPRGLMSLATTEQHVLWHCIDHGFYMFLCCSHFIFITQDIQHMFFFVIYLQCATMCHTSVSRSLRQFLPFLSMWSKASHLGSGDAQKRMMRPSTAIPFRALFSSGIFWFMGMNGIKII